jgi:hypothetical protein
MKFRLRHIAVGLLALFASWAGASRAANYTIYTDQAAWTAGLSTYFVHPSLVTTSGLSGGGPPAIFYYGQKPLPSLPNSSSEYLGMAFGGNFDLTPGGNAGGLAFQIKFEDGTTEVFWGAVNYPNPGDPNYPIKFWGIVSDTTISSVQYFSNSLTGNSETFNYSLLTVGYPAIMICRVCRRPILPIIH